uniref:N-terminal EF-hand calcium binding protein 3 n=1 Tax=Oncorhynchus mykiss TaxID=8022 RepID=A0A8C7TMY8_ONCMY
ISVVLCCLSDDGKLSFDEFNAYFADGILTTEELQELFYSLDGQQNKFDLDLKTLYDFAQHLGGYVNVLSALEILNVAILEAMNKTKKEYQDSSVLGQFVTRFMLRETSSQLLSLQMSLQCAMEAVEEQSRPYHLITQYSVSDTQRHHTTQHHASCISVLNTMHHRTTKHYGTTSLLNTIAPPHY